MELILIGVWSACHQALLIAAICAATATATFLVWNWLKRTGLVQRRP
jgi:hypothetical protein